MNSLVVVVALGKIQIPLTSRASTDTRRPALKTFSLTCYTVIGSSRVSSPTKALRSGMALLTSRKGRSGAT
jgi:hypothetical protein